MAKRLHTEIEIDADPERVWQILTDFRAYAEWNPFMTRASGTAAVGERLTIRMEPEAGPAMTFRPTVLEAAPERRLRWLGRLLLPKIFDGEHSFTIEPLDQGRVRLIQQEEFRGILAPLLARSLDSGTRPAFERMNRALKRRAEQGDWAVRCSVDHVVRPTRVATRETMEGRRARRPDEVARFGERRSRPSFPTTSGNVPALAVTRAWHRPSPRPPAVRIPRTATARLPPLRRSIVAQPMSEPHDFSQPERLDPPRPHPWASW